MFRNGSAHSVAANIYLLHAQGTDASVQPPSSGRNNNYCCMAYFDLLVLFAVTSTTVSGQSSSSGRTRTVGDLHLDAHLDPHGGSHLDPHVGSHVGSSRAPYVLLGVK